MTDNKTPFDGWVLPNTPIDAKQLAWVADDEQHPTEAKTDVPYVCKITVDKIPSTSLWRFLIESNNGSIPAIVPCRTMPQAQRAALVSVEYTLKRALKKVQASLEAIDGYVKE